MEHDKLEEELFAAALSLPADERESYLARACEDSPSLQNRLKSLIRVVDATISTKNRPFMVRSEVIGDQIDNYRLLHEIGEGGCGVVYRAEQIAPVRRNVALKIIRLGMDSKDVMTRFEAERQVLALMDHPNIAKVLDAGATASGRPYFVMELVRGVKITDYCNQVRLTVRERVELFMQVCQAIQHAHHKGIIHRDIKPSNVLVTLVDGAPVVKVIDFGIAKATQGRLTEETLLTAMEQFVGTPAYVSPEQTEPGGVRVDTRSDVYSLGVLLYELLTDSRPFDSDRTSLTEFANLRQRIRTEEPIRPSIRAANHDRLEGVAGLYGVSAKKLIQQVRGDLDWIVLRCLEKEQAHRYQTANALWSDLRQYLRHQPVAARPHGAVYALGKFARRHRVAFTVAMSFIAILMTSGVLMASLSIRLSRANTLADDINNFLGDVMNANVYAGDPTGFGRRIHLAAQARDTQVVTDRFSEAAIREVIGSEYSALELDEFAQPQFEKALAIYRKELGVGDGRTLAAAGALVRSLSRQRRYAQAEVEAANSLAILSKTHGMSHPRRAAVTTALAFYYFREGKFEAARALLEPLLARKTIDVVKVDEIERAVVNHASKGQRQQVSIAAMTLEGMEIMARVYSLEGKAEPAEQLARTVVAVRRRVLGRSEPETRRAVRVLADVYADIGEYSLAADALVENQQSSQTIDVGRRYGSTYAPSTLTTCPFPPSDEPVRPWIAENMMARSEFPDQHARIERVLYRENYCSYEQIGDGAPQLREMRIWR